MSRQYWQHDYGERWDASDIKTLLNLRYKRHRHTAAIALRMGRSEAAVRSKLYRLRQQSRP